MKKKNRNILFIIVVIFTFIIILFLIPKLKYTILIPEEQLKQEYNTVWSSVLDGAINEICIGKNFIYDTETIGISASFGNTASCTIDKTFNGEDVVVLLSANGDGYEGDYSISPTGSLVCTNSGSGTSTTTTCPQQTLIYKAHTLDTGYDVISNGVIVGSFNEPNGWKFGLSTSINGGQKNFDGRIYFIGYKARFCDIRDNEVWIQESFSQPVNINDLSFRVTQFCHEAKPFTLRKLGEGEKSIGKFEGIIPFNRGETIPNRELDNEIIIINYVTPISECSLFGCKVCGLGESNVKQSDGSFICQSFLREDEPRIIIEREIIIGGQNSFIFSGNEFMIGSERFTSEYFFNCNANEGIYFAPNPSSNCYTSRVNYEGKTTDIIDVQTTMLNDNIQVQFFSSGKYYVRSDGIESKLSGTFVFNIQKTFSVSIKEVKDNNLILNVENHLPSHTIKIIQKQRVLHTEINLNKGMNEITILLNKENFGLNEIVIQFVYPIPLLLILKKFSVY